MSEVGLTWKDTLAISLWMLSLAIWMVFFIILDLSPFIHLFLILIWALAGAVIFYILWRKQEPGKVPIKRGPKILSPGKIQMFTLDGEKIPAFVLRVEEPLHE